MSELLYAITTLMQMLHSLSFNDVSFSITDGTFLGRALKKLHEYAAATSLDILQSSVRDRNSSETAVVVENLAENS